MDILPLAPLAVAFSMLRPEAREFVALTLVSKRFKELAYISAAHRVIAYTPFAHMKSAGRWDEDEHLKNDMQRLRIYQLRASYHAHFVNSRLDVMFPRSALQAHFRERVIMDEWSLLRLVADNPYCVHRLSSRGVPLHHLLDTEDGPSEVFIEKLHALGVEFDFPDEEGKHPLERALEERREAVVGALLRCGADPSKVPPHLFDLPLESQEQQRARRVVVRQANPLGNLRLAQSDPRVFQAFNSALRRGYGGEEVV